MAKVRLAVGVHVCVLLLLVTTLTPVPMSAATVTAGPNIKISATLQGMLNEIQSYQAALNNKASITAGEIMVFGSLVSTFADQAEKEGVTTALDAWVKTNLAALQAKYPSQSASLSYLAAHGTHYVLKTAGTTMAGGANTWITSISGAHLINASSGARLLRVDCRTAAVVGSGLAAFGASAVFFGAACPILFGFGGAALVVSAFIGVGYAAYC